MREGETPQVTVEGKRGRIRRVLTPRALVSLNLLEDPESRTPMGKCDQPEKHKKMPA
jgi:hypothetical protein